MGILGVWLVVLAFLGLPSTVQRILIIMTGLFIAVFCFWKAVSEKIERGEPKQPQQ
ncbi:MAG: hypothetical protein Athens071424_189 [Parcubacteria group bacterium Athens0714_24]|nr:MAG: hypothetical protein Athens071424_189 [Parcubacteria group bacterium Athens0714_24]